MIAFWLDCENFKDTMDYIDDIDNMEIMLNVSLAGKQGN